MKHLSWIKRLKPAIILTGILMLAFALRAYRLPDLPSGFHNDEASFFYNAIALKTTGADEDGRAWPLYLNSYIDPKPALFSYLQVPFIGVFGQNVWAARLPSVLLGVASLALVYAVVVGYGVTARRALLMTALLAISPWHIMASRATQEVIMSFTFGLVALKMLQLMIGWLGDQKRPIWHWGLVSLGWVVSSVLAMYSYHSLKIVLPILVVASLLYLLDWKRRWPVLLVMSGVIGIVAVGVTLASSAGLDRFKDISLFSTSDVYLILDEQIKTSTGRVPAPVIRLFHNKVINTGLALSHSYFEHFTPEFLFLSGGSPDRYDVPFHGLLFLVELVLIGLGVWVAFQIQPNKSRSMARAVFFLIWWLAAPLPAVLTAQELPSTIRTFWMTVPIYFFVAVGIEGIFSVRSQLIKVSGLGAVMIGYLWGGSYFWHQLTVFQPYYHPWSRNYADTAMAERITPYLAQYPSVVVGRFSGQPYIYLALAGHLPLSSLQSSYPLRMQPEFTLGQFTFNPDSCPVEKKTGVLFVIRENCRVPSYYRPLTEANYLDGNDGYVLVVYEPSLDLELLKN